MTSTSDPRVTIMFAAYAIAASLAVVAVRAARSGLPAALFAVIWGALCFAPASNVAFVVGTTIGERLLYLPSAPFCLLLAALAAPLQPRLSFKLVWQLAIAAVAAAVLTSRCRAEILPYRCDSLLWNATLVRSAPEALSKRDG